MGRRIRRTLVRFVRLFVQRPLLGVGAAAGLAAFMVAAVFVLPMIMGAPGQMPRLSMPFVQSGTAPQATEDYLRGNREYDAARMWQSLDIEAQQRIRSSGGTVEQLQLQMQAARDRGMSLQEVSYIGGKSLPDGSSFQFYLVGVRQNANADVEYVPYLFTLDRDGKIAKIQ